MFYASVSAAAGAFLINFVPHTFLVYKHREFVATYREGAERPVSEAINKRYEIAQEILKVNDFDRQFMQREFM